MMAEPIKEPVQDGAAANTAAASAVPIPAPTAKTNASDSPVPHTLPHSTTSAPMLRPLVQTGRSASGTRAPRLGLAIPPSPNVKPVNGDDTVPKPTVPMMKPPMPSLYNNSQERGRTPRPQISLAFGNTSHSTLQTTSSSEHSTISRSDSNGDVSLSQTVSSHGNDPKSAVSSSSNGPLGVALEQDASSSVLPDLEKLSLEKGRALDVDDLDDAGWRAAARTDRIEQLGELGEGAGGAVHRCKLKGSSTVFALKTILGDPNPDVKKQIMRELEFNKNCTSEYICRYFGAFVNDSTGVISIAMEYCEGGSLDAIYREIKRRGGRTGEKPLGRVAEGVLHGLTYLNDHRIIHRDIKPSNILLCRNGQVRLCDFGVSGESGTKGDANTFIGTSYYMAPERITGKSYTITSDVWSLGVSLLEVAQHRFPFPADGTDMNPRAGILDLLTYIVGQPIPQLKDEPENKVFWSENFKYFIDSCLARDVKRRAMPWKMLEHPWMVEMRAEKVNMSRYLARVWGWELK